MLHVREMEDFAIKEVDDEFQFDFECDDHEQNLPWNSSRYLEDKSVTQNKYHSRINDLNGTNTLFSLEEDTDEGQHEHLMAKGPFSCEVGNQGVNLGGENPPHTSSWNMILHNHIPGDLSYVTLADMT